MKQRKRVEHDLRAGDVVRVLDCADLRKPGCTRVIGAVGQVVRSVPDYVLVKFKMNVYPGEMEASSKVVLLRNQVRKVEQPMPQASVVVTTGEIMKRWGISRGALYQWLRNVEHPFPRPINIGYPKLYREADVVAWIEAHKSPE